MQVYGVAGASEARQRSGKGNPHKKGLGALASPGLGACFHPPSPTEAPNTTRAQWCGQTLGARCLTRMCCTA